MEIRISIQTTEPLAGAARTETEGPVRFEGWLELLHVLSTLIGSERSSKEGGSDERTNDGDTDGGAI